jgi:hypothetical protein
MLRAAFTWKMSTFYPFERRLGGPSKKIPRDMLGCALAVKDWIQKHRKMDAWTDRQVNRHVGR